MDEHRQPKSYEQNTRSDFGRNSSPNKRRPRSGGDQPDSQTNTNLCYQILIVYYLVLTVYYLVLIVYYQLLTV